MKNSRGNWTWFFVSLSYMWHWTQKNNFNSTKKVLLFTIGTNRKAKLGVHVVCAGLTCTVIKSPSDTYGITPSWIHTEGVHLTDIADMWFVLALLVVGWHIKAPAIEISSVIAKQLLVQAAALLSRKILIQNPSWFIKNWLWHVYFRFGLKLKKTILRKNTLLFVRACSAGCYPQAMPSEICCAVARDSNRLGSYTQLYQMLNNIWIKCS